ncbi:hypothetical protein [Leptolyngbya sp. O-77]|uniref:hypothetical protein n=1 Tax=Leptolyngbya sp. O-77 TaxID=1080068 RepID=UPI002570B630|nr:hypothetical protein [Leptolyngbya sp. O-77]
MFDRHLVSVQMESGRVCWTTVEAIAQNRHSQTCRVCRMNPELMRAPGHRH